MSEHLPTLVFAAGCLQLCVLIASSLVPLRLNWKTSLDSLPRLYRQLYWIYGGYVVMGILFNGVIAIVCAVDLAGDTRLARFVCGYIALFWGVRLSLQALLDVKEHLTVWWLHAGYHTLTALFVTFTVFFGYVALR